MNQVKQTTWEQAEEEIQGGDTPYNVSPRQNTPCQKDASAKQRPRPKTLAAHIYKKPTFCVHTTGVQPPQQRAGQWAPPNIPQYLVVMGVWSTYTIRSLGCAGFRKISSGTSGERGRIPGSPVAVRYILIATSTRSTAEMEARMVPPGTHRVIKYGRLRAQDASEKGATTSEEQPKKQTDNNTPTS